MFNIHDIFVQKANHRKYGYIHLKITARETIQW